LAILQPGLPKVKGWWGIAKGNKINHVQPTPATYRHRHDHRIGFLRESLLTCLFGPGDGKGEILAKYPILPFAIYEPL
jgi:hypothetical protein